MRSVFLAIIGLACMAPPAAGQAPDGQKQPTFRSGVARVAVTAVVRDRAGRSVQGLSRTDFELFDGGERRPIVDFNSARAATSVAILLDVSGSMAIGSKSADARSAIAQLVSWLDSDTDEVAVYAFDSILREQRPFSPATADVARLLPSLAAFGSTSLYDAIAQVGERAVAQGRSRQAIVVVTDGVDTSSRLSAADASRFASEIDVPVYVIAVVTTLDEPGMSARSKAATGVPADRSLEALAQKTGGLLFTSSTPARASLAARQIASELHQSYQLAFEPSSQTGWHALSLRTRQQGLLVRSRSGYVVGSHPTNEPSSPHER